MHSMYVCLMFWHYYKSSKVIKVVNIVTDIQKISLVKTSQAMRWLKKAELLQVILIFTH